MSPFRPSGHYRTSVPAGPEPTWNGRAWTSQGPLIHEAPYSLHPALHRLKTELRGEGAEAPWKESHRAYPGATSETV